MKFGKVLGTLFLSKLLKDLVTNVDGIPVIIMQAEEDASAKDKELTEALERMRQYEAVSNIY